MPMLISKASVAKFVCHNATLVGIAFLHFALINIRGELSCDPLFGAFVFLFLLVRNLGLCELVRRATASEKQVHGFKMPVENFEGEHVLFVAQAAVMEAATGFFIGSSSISNDDASNSSTSSTTMYKTMLTLVLFVPVSFVFEITYDLFHYIVHRWMHSTRFSFHSTHHRHAHLVPILTFYQHPLDLFFSNVVPFLLAEMALRRILLYPLSRLELTLIATYKTFVEIGGHSGKPSFPSTSFTQFFWLPKLLGIELAAEDHDLHHKNGTKNFAKRFSLWDKVFGSWQCGKRRRGNSRS